jgi:hypothetical protein
MQENDYLAVRQQNGLFKILRLTGGERVPVRGHEDEYDEAEVRRRLTQLRASGNCWIHDGGGYESFRA